jgi:PKHD-type hydroxylase
LCYAFGELPEHGGCRLVIPFMLGPRSSSRRRPWAAVDDVFTTDELDRIVQAGDRLASEEARVGRQGRVDPNLRTSRLAWFHTGQELDWVFERLGGAASELNDRYFGFDLFGFCERLQYSVYEAPGGHFRWHVDSGSRPYPRKLSLSLQLSEPTEYQGGSLELMGSDQPWIAPRRRGTLIAFPSYCVHRVQPVEVGVRRAMVGWVAGPEFR